MNYGSVDVVCTYDNGNNNVCLFTGEVFEIGQMCAHQIFAVGQYAVLACRKTFYDATVAKIHIYTAAEGVFVGSVSTPKITGYKASPTDSVTVMQTGTGIRVAW